LAAAVSLYAAPEKYPPGLYAQLQTNKGLIVLELVFQKTPLTVANFVGLAEGKIENAVFPLDTPYFNGTLFHRVVPGHVIQAGMPQGKDVEGPGYEFPNEIDPSLRHERAGILGMANGGPHTNGSQFYITLAERSYLDGDYTVFGRVLSGMDVVNNITQGDLIEKVTIVRVGQKAERFQPNTASFQRLLKKTWQRVKKAATHKKRDEEKIIRRQWPDLLTTGDGLRYRILSPGQGEKAKSGDTLSLRYQGQMLDGRTFASSAGSGWPAPGTTEATFPFVIGQTQINPGFDQSVAAMLPGEKRLIIIPAALAYGDSGFYAKSVPGQKRFVISPGTTLVYEIEVLAPKK
jgi:peptidylprolyl isomerase